MRCEKGRKSSVESSVFGVFVCRSLIEPIPAQVQRMFANAKFGEGGEITEASTIKLTYLLSRVNDTNRKSGDDCKKGCNPTLQVCFRFCWL